mmetsp:Transcript_4248/g.9653  ORF Transcript_4248/g.9653 Transcript_4248/m.9653 type:complete len:178 (-) Transcript_4248:1122-1655(-)
MSSFFGCLVHHETMTNIDKMNHADKVLLVMCPVACNYLHSRLPEWVASTIGEPLSGTAFIAASIIGLSLWALIREMDVNEKIIGAASLGCIQGCIQYVCSVFWPEHRPKISSTILVSILVICLLHSAICTAYQSRQLAIERDETWKRERSIRAKNEERERLLEMRQFYGKSGHDHLK